MCVDACSAQPCEHRVRRVVLRASTPTTGPRRVRGGAGRRLHRPASRSSRCSRADGRPVVRGAARRTAERGARHLRRGRATRSWPRRSSTARGHSRSRAELAGHAWTRTRGPSPGVAARRHVADGRCPTRRGCVRAAARPAAPQADRARRSRELAPPALALRDPRRRATRPGHGAPGGGPRPRRRCGSTCAPASPRAGGRRRPPCWPFAAWLAGDGALAWCALDRCRARRARPALAATVADLLDRRGPASAGRAGAGLTRSAWRRGPPGAGRRRPDGACPGPRG